jgi:hypothetical protein
LDTKELSDIIGTNFIKDIVPDLNKNFMVMKVSPEKSNPKKVFYESVLLFILPKKSTSTQKIISQIEI